LQAVGKEKIPVRFLIKEISEDGQIKIEFNQDLEIPSILKSDGKRRILLGLDEVDMRNIIMLTIVQKSEGNSNDLGYFMTAKEWTS
jgi:hypothetical protein